MPCQHCSLLMKVFSILLPDFTFTYNDMYKQTVIGPVTGALYSFFKILTSSVVLALQVTLVYSHSKTNFGSHTLGSIHGCPASTALFSWLRYVQHPSIRQVSYVSQPRSQHGWGRAPVDTAERGVLLWEYTSLTWGASSSSMTNDVNILKKEYSALVTGSRANSVFVCVNKAQFHGSAYCRIVNVDYACAQAEIPGSSSNPWNTLDMSAEFPASV